MSDEMSENMSDRMPDRLPDRMPGGMSGYMPDRMPEYMPEYMSDRMSEYTKYMSKYTSWHVMVGITRSRVIVMFPVKHTVIYTFFAITSVQNTCFCSVFNALASKNPAKSCYVQCFFHFWPFFHCRKATKMTQNSISIPSCAQTPKNPRKMSKTPPYLVSVRNRFWGLVSVRNRFCPPPS